MAISTPLYKLFRSIQHMLPRGGSLLEIGEANWYGEDDPSALFPCRDTGNGFTICKDFYADLFAPESFAAIDFNGTPEALRLDLNQPITLDRQFDVVINHGTAEHVFNVGQVFKTIHERCELHGVMIHDAPFNGWVDHGFYCFQPTLFYDLAMANCYEVAYVALYEIKSGFTVRIDARECVPQVAATAPQNCNLFVVLKKRIEQPFRLPLQGYYGRTISDSVRKSWEENR